MIIEVIITSKSRNYDFTIDFLYPNMELMKIMLLVQHLLNLSHIGIKC